MFCPSCKYEYIKGATRCTDCDVALVEKLDSPDAESGDDTRIVAIWKGKDGGEFQKIQEALDNAEIPTMIPDTKSSFQMTSTDPMREIWISQEDLEKANKILLELEGQLYPDELTPEQIESLALPASDRPDSPDSEDQPIQRNDLSQEWYEDDPTSEVWTGDSEELSDSLIMCLREIGIASRKLSDSGHWRVVVRPEQETRAKEIVREIVDASPPE